MPQRSDAAAPTRSARTPALSLRPQLRRELVATLLVFAALYVAGALVSSPADGAAHCWSGASRFGPAGACTRAVSRAILGPLASALLPLLPLLFAARTLGRATHRQARGALIALAGVAVVIATAAALVAGIVHGFSGVRGPAGVLGAGVAVTLTSVIGVVGAWIAMFLALIVAGRVAMEAAGIRAFAIRWRRRRARAATLPDASLVVATPPLALDALQAEEPEPLPSAELLQPVLSLAADAASRDRETLEFRLVGALRHLQLDVTVVGRVRGPAVTRYEIEISPATPVRDFGKLAGDIGSILRTTRVRIAPISGQVAIGIELPNGATSLVSLRELIESPAFHDGSRLLPIALGRELGGHAVVADLAKMPHLLIAGDAESGKTVALNGVITSLVYRHSARTLRLLIIDTDEAGLGVYDHLPHLREPVVTDYRAAASSIEAVAEEASARYALLATSGARNLQDFNQRVAEGSFMGATLPHLVVAMDDAADLLRAAPEVERPLTHLASRARAVGIHLVAVTKRPMSAAFSAAFLANFPARAALRAAQVDDSITMIERAGAETLIGSGDMLFLPPGRSESLRVQAPLVSSEETRRLVQWFATRAGVTLPEPAARPAEATDVTVTEAAGESNTAPNGRDAA